MGKRQRLLVSVACALLAMVTCALYARHIRGSAERERAEVLKRYGGEVAALVVSERTLEAGEVVSAADVRMSDWVASLAPADAFLDLDDVVGRQVTVPVGEGIPLTSLNFRDDAALADIPSGHVAVTIPVTDKLGIATGIAVGSHVMAYSVSDGATELIAGDATVLVAPAAGGSLASRGTLTVAVAQDEVPAVLAAETSGDLRLVVPAKDVRVVAEKSEAPTEVAPVQGTRGDGA